MIHGDITQLCFADNTFDAVIASHVLEHIPDDKKAIKEIHRVLKDGGWAILQVPIKGKYTFEDPSIKNPDERIRVFGQSDHVRIYGEDYYDKLREAGFNVLPSKLLIQDDIKKCRELGISRKEYVTYITKMNYPKVVV